MFKLTKRQAEILELIVEHFEIHHHPPTVRQLGAATGITSTNGVNDHLRALIRKGYLARVKGQSRGIKVLRLPDGRRVIGAKLLAVGSPTMDKGEDA